MSKSFKVMLVKTHIEKPPVNFQVSHLQACNKYMSVKLLLHKEKYFGNYLHCI